MQHGNHVTGVGGPGEVADPAHGYVICSHIQCCQLEPNTWVSSVKVGTSDKEG